MFSFQMKAMQGIKFSYRLQTLIQKDVEEPVRGIRFEENNSVALNNFIYSLIRSSRNYRRALLSSMLNLFDDTAVSEFCRRVLMVLPVIKISELKCWMADKLFLK